MTKTAVVPVAAAPAVAVSSVRSSAAPVVHSPSHVATGYRAMVDAARAPAGSDVASAVAAFAASLVGDVYGPFR